MALGLHQGYMLSSFLSLTVCTGCCVEAKTKAGVRWAGWKLFAPKMRDEHGKVGGHIDLEKVRVFKHPAGWSLAQADVHEVRRQKISKCGTQVM